MLLYYPLTTESRDIFSANAPTAVFLDWMRGMCDESLGECVRYEYLIIRAPEHPNDGSRYNVLYRNASYAVFHPKNSDDGNRAIDCR